MHDHLERADLQRVSAATIDRADAMRAALALHRAGRLDEAGAAYRLLIERNPRDAEAIHMLGVTHLQQGRFDAAIAAIEQALAIQPDDALARCNLAGALIGLGRHHDALIQLEQSTAVDPHLAIAHHNRALALRALGRGSESLEATACTLRLAPTHVEALALRGSLLGEQGRLDAAADCYRRAAAALPEDAEMHFELANVLYRSGQFDAALVAYDKAATLRPRYVEAWNNRAATLLALDRPEESLQSSQRAIDIDGSHATAHVNKGNALLRLRRPGEAVTSFDDALELRPTLTRALVNRAAALLELGRQAEALEDAQSALELQPADIDCRIMQARALLACRRPAEALAAIDAALSIDPHSANALVNRAAALIDLGLAEDALVACDGALALRADHVAALTNRAAALLQMGLGQEALACIESALRHDDSDTDALMAHALALASLRRHEEAISVAESAIYRNPESPRPWFHCAAVLLSARRPDAAVACFDAAREAGAPNAAALSDRAAALVLLGRHAEASESLGRALELDPEFPYARGARLEARLHVCDWQDYEEETARIRDAVRSGRRVASPFALAAIPSTAAEQAQCARTYAADVVRSGPAWPRASVSAHDRIRIAYLSADFRDHPVAHLIVDLIESHDRRDFETFGIALGAGCDDPMRQRLRGAFDHFIEADALSDQAIAHRLRELEIDIAVDLMGYTRECRPGILARRPVPVQVSYLGFPGTMGAPFIDYLIADRHVVPPAEHEHYDERIVYLPHCFMANHQRRPVADHAVSRASAGLPERGFVFCCLNASYKIAPPVFGAWMRLLRAVPGSVLWLSAKDAARENLRRHAATHGVDGQRLVFASRVSSYSEYLARYRLADLFLDTLPYNAHATATDALWAGLPLLTCTGGTFAGRVATSLLHAIGLPDLVTSSLSGYEALAFDLATDPARLRTLRERLAANRTTRPLFNGAGFRMSIESAYREMHRSHRSGQAPGSFAVH